MCPGKSCADAIILGCQLTAAVVIYARHSPLQSGPCVNIGDDTQRAIKTIQDQAARLANGGYSMATEVHAQIGP